MTAGPSARGDTRSRSPREGDLRKLADGDFPRRAPHRRDVMASTLGMIPGNFPDVKRF
jgi:hypothetical protein